jgi:hypothetical protein
MDASNSDGLVEVVGLKSGYHAGVVMAGAMHAVRLAQAAGVRIRARGAGKAKKDGFARAYLQLDGEPWKQDVPPEDSPKEEALEVRPSASVPTFFHPVVDCSSTGAVAAY